MQTMQKQRMTSVQAKLTATILIIFLVAMLTLGGLNYWKARDAVNGLITATMADKAETSAQDLGAWLDTRKAELNMLASNPTIVGGDKDAILPLLVAANNTDRANYNAMIYVDAAGNSCASDGGRLQVADRVYFKTAIQGTTIVCDPATNKVSGALSTIIAVPVKVGDRVVGVVAGAINMSEVARKVLNIQMGQTGYSLLSQQDGLTIIHPNPEVSMKANPLQDADADPGQKAVIEHSVQGEKGLMTVKSKGVERYYAFAPVPGTGWSLAVTVPVSEASGVVSALTVITGVTIVVVLLITALFIVWFARRFTRPILTLEAAANRIAGGDLSQTGLNINSRDEIGRLGNSFEQMARSLHTLIKKVQEATDQVSASSQQLTASSEQSAQAANQIAASITAVSTGANEQLAASDQTAAVVEKISARIQQLAANANQVAARSAQAAGKAKDGDRTVEKAVAQMGHIETTVTASAEVVAKLGEQSKEIGQIVDTIAGIAGQTNLLALNAAIEAARAGEQGRGFAVVAEEVRKLAEQSEEAAKKIAALIGEIQSDTDQAVAAMGDGTREVKTGADVVDAAGKAFREIAALVAEVSGQVKDISAAMQQMAGDSQQIVDAVKKIDALGKKAVDEAQGVSAAAQEQLASMEEIAASSQSLAKLAQDLQSAVTHFRI